MKVKTSSGFEAEISEQIGLDYRFIRLIRDMDEGKILAIPALVELVLGEKGAEALEKHVQLPDGTVPLTAIQKELTELFQAKGELKN